MPDGQAIFYNDAPPSFGEHYNTPDPMERKLVNSRGRPAQALHAGPQPGARLHDPLVRRDGRRRRRRLYRLRGIADKFAGTSNLRFKFKAVPWLESDGKAFPDDQHIAFTHWSIGGADQDPAGEGQVGVWQFCSAVPGEALNDFMLKYPYMDSPEPNAM